MADQQLEGEIGDLYYINSEKKSKPVKEGDISPSIISELNKTSDYYIKGFDNSDEGLDSITELYKTITKLESVDNTINEKAGEGFETLLGGTILKQIVKYNTKENDSGYRKRIFIRWDMLCQILNKLSIFEYKKDKPISEFTYLNSNRPTFAKGKNRVTAEPNTFYLAYSLNKPNTLTEVRLNGVTLQGQSLDDSVCLMPHQSIFDNLFGSGFTIYDPTANDAEGRSSDVLGSTKYEKDLTPDKRTAEDKVQGNAMNFTSFNGVTADRNSIGLVYFNLDHVLEEYEDMRLESIDDGNGKFRTRLKKDFSLFDFVKKLWEDVNDACGGYYDFKLTTEHERPHVARIIDFTFSGKVEPNKPIYTFNPQGLNSVSRQFSFNSKISSDFASVISIAAQSPGSIHSLNAMSFKAFNRDIKSRFTDEEFDEKGRKEEANYVRNELIRDVKEYKSIKQSLTHYLEKLNKGNFEFDSEKNQRPTINVNSAKVSIERLEELYNSIYYRHPLYKEDDSENKDLAGFYKEDITLDRSAIIPLTFNIQLDGIAGVIPLQLFKIKKDKLPLAYKRDDIAFIVKGETHQITSGQDWVVEINGQLTLLNNGEDNPGNNGLKEEDFNNLSNFADEIDAAGKLINPTFDQNLESITLNSSFPKRNNGTDWHLGIDLGMPQGTSLVAAGAGTVEIGFQGRRDNDGVLLPESEDDIGSGYGKYIILTLDMSDPRITSSGTRKILYAHLSGIDNNLQNGSTVKKGDRIAFSGGSAGTPGAGSSEGPHLHYEVGTNFAFTPTYFSKKGDETKNQRRERLYNYGRTNEEQGLTVIDPLKIIDYPNAGIGIREQLYRDDFNENNDGIILNEDGTLGTETISETPTNPIDLTPPTIEGENFITGNPEGSIDDIDEFLNSE